MKKFLMGLVVGVLIIGLVSVATAYTVSGRFTIFRAADGTNLSAEFYQAYTVIKELSQKPENYTQQDLHDLTRNLRVALATLAFMCASEDVYKTGRNVQDLEL